MEFLHNSRKKILLNADVGALFAKDTRIIGHQIKGISPYYFC